MKNTKVTIAGVEFKNPVMTASGTFGSGMEYSEFVDLNCLGAVVTKGVANVPWEGNPTPRVMETYGGMLNAIGLQNPGIDVFIERDIPFLKQFDTRIIVNVCGRTVEDYIEDLIIYSQKYQKKIIQKSIISWKMNWIFQMKKSMRKLIILQENYMKQMAQRFYLHVWLILLWKFTKKN